VAGWRVLHGADPYVWPRAEVAAGISFPYPPLAAVLFAPLALLAPSSAAAVYTAISIAAILGALAAVRVGDWRLYGLVLLFAPVVTGWQTGNMTLLIALGVALLWRSRDRPLWAGMLLALLVCVKPIALPLGLWLLATRRYTAAAWAAALGLVLSLIGWAFVGTDALRNWIRLLSVQGDLLYRKGYGVIAFVTDAGFGRTAGTASAIVVTLAIAVMCAMAARRRRDLAAFALAVVMMITISPQVDQHYFVLLLVPLAIARPRLEPIWAVPLALWVCPSPSGHVHLWQAALFWVAAATVIVSCMRPAAKPASASSGGSVSSTGPVRPRAAQL
jgi:alpha-1,2-mannosyltransferase